MAVKLDHTKLVKNLGSQYKLVPHLDKAIAEHDFAWQYNYQPKQSDTAWHPSSDCTPPITELLHKARNYEPKQVTGQLRKTFAVGHYWHAYLQEILKRIDFADEEAIEREGTRKWDSQGRKITNVVPAPYHWVRGSADVAPVTIPRHGEFLVDFKTTSSHDFTRQGAPHWAADKWESQVNIYMDLFNLDRALIVCIQKDSPHDFREIEYHRNQPLIDTLYSRWHQVSHALNTEAELSDEEDYLPFKGPAK